jgi:hypothetical protein
MQLHQAALWVTAWVTKSDRDGTLDEENDEFLAAPAKPKN